MPAGRPTSYKAEYAKQAQKLCNLGATDIDLANFFEVSEQTIYTWKRKHKEFLEAIKIGKEVADEEVTRSLYQRALGYRHDHTELFHYKGTVVEHKTVKVYPPDTMACIYWLNNRRPDLWRNKHDITTNGKEVAAAVFTLPDGTNVEV